MLQHYKTLDLRREAGGVLHLTLNRPELRNALSLEMVAELRVALADAEGDGETRVLVLRGAGGHFCAGADLKDMAQARMRMADEGAGVLQQMNAAFGHLCGAFARSPLAVVAVLEGSVMGGGFGLACVADLVLGSETVSFRLPETSLGLVPAQIAPFLVERLGYSQARRLAVSGGRLDAPQAFQLGLVHELHAGAQLDAALTRHLGGMLQCAPQAVAATKRLMARACHHEAASLVEEAAEAFAHAAAGPEGQEGVMAFVEQRKPRWAPQ